MKLLINKDGKTNFAVAGGAIMAGAKIFSSRVDALETISNKWVFVNASQLKTF